MPSAVSTRVMVRPTARETVRAPLEYEPLAIAIRATPCETATRLNSGFALGKLAPTRTSATRPLIAIRAAPVAASVRNRCGWLTAAVVPADGGGAEVELVLGVGRPADAAPTCCTNGSFPAKWLKE